jgi:hypothetical protein
VEHPKPKVNKSVTLHRLRQAKEKSDDSSRWPPEHFLEGEAPHREQAFVIFNDHQQDVRGRQLTF